jgi:eukaryotic-like serine/threonine-protein kinase
LPAVPGRTLDARYTLLRTLGKGATSSVWVALDHRLDRTVAVKLLDPAADEAVSCRFDREARITSRLRDPHIIELFDYGTDADQPFLVLELLHGQTLTAHLREHRRLQLHELTAVIRQAARGLAVAHATGIVHRDVKPSNLFVCARDGLVKLLDFGAAKSFADVHPGVSTAPGWTIGTPLFMSPEQINARQPLGPWTDVWALACVSFLALTGTTPFYARRSMQIVQRILEEEPSRPTAHGLHPSLDSIFAWALAKDIGDRCSDPLAFASALDDLVADVGGVPAAPPHLALA